MIKECNVLLANKDILVIDFDGASVQLSNPTNHQERSAYIKLEDRKYSLTSKEEYESSKTVTKKKTAKVAVKSEKANDTAES